jgi:hypothetical protein
MKLKKNLTFMPFVTIYLFTSTVFSFLTYTIFFNLSEIILFAFKQDGDTNVIDYVKGICYMTSYISYSLISVLLIAYAKDVVYAIVHEYILIPFLLSSIYNEFENGVVTSIVLLSFNLVAIVASIIKYRKTIFGFEDEQEFVNNLFERDKKSSLMNTRYYADE